MSRGVYVALSGAVAQEHALETTATNLANASTAGYQRLRPVFREVLAGASRRENLRYVAVGATALDGSRGAIRSTGRALDVALPAGSYLAVTTSRGERYTRAGALTMGADGILRAAGVPLVRNDGKPIQLSPAGPSPVVDASGSVVQDGEVVAKLRIVRAGPGTTFAHEGAGLFVASGAVVEATAEDATLEVGVLEESNATAVAAMTELVTTTRTFEAFQRMLDTFGECDRRVLTTTPGPTE